MVRVFIVCCGPKSLVKYSNADIVKSYDTFIYRAGIDHLGDRTISTEWGGPGYVYR